MDLHSLKLDETMGTLISQNLQYKMGLHSLTGADHLEYPEGSQDPEVSLGDEGENCQEGMVTLISSLDNFLEMLSGVWK